jgi:Trypsin
MSRLPRSPSPRLGAITVASLALAACVLALAVPTAGASELSEGRLVPYIIGGQEASTAQFPWQVYVQSVFVENGQLIVGSCGGSILSPTEILTAAHCTDAEGTTIKRPASEFAVVAGDSNLNERPLPATAQERSVASIRTHPYYTPLPDIKDDAAVLTLTEPLTLSPEKDAQAIGLAGATPPGGTAMTVSGYGKQEGAEGAAPNGKLYSTTLTAISSDACRNAVGEFNSAVLLCAAGPSSATCQGDSGGPLVEGSPAVEVGLVDIGGQGCPVNSPDGFTNVTAPEVRAFIEGSETPPVAARPTSPPAIKWLGAAPVDFSTLTCEPGAWNGSPSFTYTFQAENASAQALQSGPSNVFSPPSALVGVPVVCIVQASNPGGVTTYRSGTTPPVALDTAPPSAAITALKCSGQACALSITASDPNALALTLQATGTYTATVKCPKKKTQKKKKKGKKPAKAPVCHAPRTVKMSLRAIAPGAYQATVSHLPYGKPITFTVAVADVAGLRPAKAPARSTVLHPPPRKTKGKSNQGKKNSGGGVGPIGLSSG